MEKDTDNNLAFPWDDWGTYTYETLPYEWATFLIWAGPKIVESFDISIGEYKTSGEDVSYPTISLQVKLASPNNGREERDECKTHEPPNHDR